jgi:hypothetical protein
MSIRIFLPSGNLVKTALQTIQILAVIGAAIAILAALTLAGHVLILFCGVLTVLIQAFSSVCQTAYIALGSSQISIVFTYIALTLINIKFACILFPSLPTFFSRRSVLWTEKMPS